MGKTGERRNERGEADSYSLRSVREETSSRKTARQV